MPRGLLDDLAALAAPCAAILLARGQTVAIADGSTGGLIATGLIAIPGASGFMKGGGTIYSAAGRLAILGPGFEFIGPRTDAETYTLLQASAVRSRFEADWGIAEAGAAGPSHPDGIASGSTCIAIIGPAVLRTRSASIASTSRTRTMEAFARAALTLFHETLIVE